jgi:hypothetical protein
MNAKQLERASYLAAHAVLAANISAPHLATPGARRSYMVDAIANQIRNVFELHCSAFDEPGDWPSARVLQAPLQEEPSEETVPSRASANKLQLVMQKLH